MEEERKKQMNHQYKNIDNQLYFEEIGEYKTDNIKLEECFQFYKNFDKKLDEINQKQNISEQKIENLLNEYKNEKNNLSTYCLNFQKKLEKLSNDDQLIINELLEEYNICFKEKENLKKEFIILTSNNKNFFMGMVII